MSLLAEPLPAASRFAPLLRLLPGLLLCCAVTAGAWLLQFAEEQVFGRAHLEALVLAILLGTLVRSLWTPGKRFMPGVAFSAKMLLEVAVVLLGASISAQAVIAVGPRLVIGIMVVVAVAPGRQEHRS